MTIKKRIPFCLLLLCQFVLAQQDSIALDEVVVFDRQLREFSHSQSVLRLNDSVIANNQSSLSGLLNYNSSIYFKENGPGMVSSPSFRGTTAQQTAVVWNGININSQFNGQTDFNTIATQGFDAVAVRSGGGSVIYGSSAIGGSVHLNNDLLFSDHFENSLMMDYGSFKTVGAGYKADIGSDVVAVQIGISNNRSANDFEIHDQDRENLNGQYQNTTIDFGVGFKIDSRNKLRILNYAYDGERHFSLISPSDSKTKYRDRNSRTLLEWTNQYGALSSRVKAAYLIERYDFFDNIENPASNYGDARTLAAKYDGLYAVNSNMALNFLADFTQTTAAGSDLGEQKRHIASFALLLKHRPIGKLTYEIGVRQEITSSYDSPILFSAGAAYRLSESYKLKVNASKNFRIPTFNDMYWFEGGNPNLKPETALQGEIGNVFNYKNWQLSVTGYYISIRDMIQWLPGTTAFWNPVNVTDVKSYGVENALNWDKKIGGHEFALTATYTYTISENERTGHQLIYVPFHKATAGFAYSRRKFSIDFQSLFCGEVFTRSDNDVNHIIDSYNVTNIGSAYDIGRRDVVKIGARILNVFDENYHVVAGRPFPGRNFNLFLNLKF